MRLHLGCGAVRPKKNWVNIDTLFSIFPNHGAPERKQLDEEEANGTYLDHDITKPLPFADNSIEGIAAIHVIEHLDAIECLSLFVECYRVLAPNGVLRIGVPCPKIFYDKSVTNNDDWGEGNPSNMSFMEYALFFPEHKQILSEDALKCYFWLAKFKDYKRFEFMTTQQAGLCAVDNRPKFSLFMEGIK